ncbi:hypothetical protein SERLA73DRAFT_115348 [Serpula lacrymans var. lacrymans S7.3]|uniref:FAD-binding FR-type domain-containing protein n=2 Tax=Serpula lacrymans var. lacrymans TaxID=341189 RepID=F8QCN2_SERL3|nr:uncharacterized protein SERLADRAFT_358633 [Serpula lacrymans var. lacrymans S7.9]EGN93897.1 hypothetical protein SERLA73DRAFT_115348 [Serpula lacrymans var. lacrymans S7.3]EGO19263.1 hypothetical protein SERLADRAFT_358633 [Serpula lacrymans var. lacrymans S7.9]
MSALNGWHRGELAIQRKLNFDGPMATAWTWIDGEMPEQHKVFHTTQLPFVPVTTLDDKRRPWSSILASPNGQPGFISSPHYTELTMSAKVWDGDPFVDNSALLAHTDHMLIAGIGIEFSTRRRNKFAGWIKDIKSNADRYEVKVVVNQALGNCPKYINVRDLIPHPVTNPKILHRRLELAVNERLPEELISFVHEADTVFLGTSYEATEQDTLAFPSHLGMNQRGGRQGFVRVSPSDGRTLILPDYSGNRLMSSLGNIEATPRASMTFVSFTSGSILYLTGDAKTLIGKDAQRVMPLQNAITTVSVTGYVFVEDALPVRQLPGSEVQRSAYSPPIRYLADETSALSQYYNDDTQVMLSSVELHSPDIATFTFQSEQDLEVKPGQTAILDFKAFLGSQRYQHMAPTNPTSVNDDRIRTWTISRSNGWHRPAPLPSQPARSFSLTMRRKPGGAVTEALFSISSRLAEMKSELLDDTRPLGLTVGLVGISGDFTLPEVLADACQDPRTTTANHPQKLLWIAGGIGVTPFISMLNSLSDLRDSSPNSTQSYDINLLISTREPSVLLPLITRALQTNAELNQKDHGNTPTMRITIDVFTTNDVSDIVLDEMKGIGVTLRCHRGRISGALLKVETLGDLSERKIYLCGPPLFEDAVLADLASVGIDGSRVKREMFAY